MVTLMDNADRNRALKRARKFRATANDAASSDSEKATAQRLLSRLLREFNFLDWEINDTKPDWAGEQTIHTDEYLLPVLSVLANYANVMMVTPDRKSGVAILTGRKERIFWTQTKFELLSHDVGSKREDYLIRSRYFNPGGIVVAGSTPPNTVLKDYWIKGYTQGIFTELQELDREKPKSKPVVQANTYLEGSKSSLPAQIPEEVEADRNSLISYATNRGEDKPVDRGEQRPIQLENLPLAVLKAYRHGFNCASERREALR